MSPSSETLHRTNAVIALAVGIGAMFAPKPLARLYGMDPDELTGVAMFGWRLFAARNLVYGFGALRGAPGTRDVTLAVQAVDQLVFLQAFRSRSIPRKTSVAAILTSGAIVATGLRARSAP